jgi:RNA polymerase sigma-70 factor (ECF subfamily)
MTCDHEIVGLVTRAQQGDPQAFAVLYQRFADPIFHYCYAHCRDHTLAEDLTADLWLRVVETLPTFYFPAGASPAAFAGWIYRIARNLLVDATRQAHAPGTPLGPTLRAAEPPAEELVLRREGQQELHRALQQLTAAQREVLLLRFGAGWNWAEVGQWTGRSEGAVKLLQHRALRALRRLLERPPQRDGRVRTRPVVLAGEEMAVR